MREARGRKGGRKGGRERNIRFCANLECMRKIFHISLKK